MQEILKKIEKLLALTSSPNENEAQRASEKVQELLAAHNLSLADLPREKSQEDVGETTVLSSTKVVEWKRTLLIAVACFYDCETMTWRRRRSVDVLVVGTTANTGVVILMYEYFVKALERVVCDERRKGMKVTPTFRHGIALRISKKLADKKESMKRDGIHSECRNISAIVLQNQAEKASRDIANYYAKNHPSIKIRSSSFKTSEGLAQGYEAGDRIGVDTQLNPTSQQRQLARAR
jgi:Protein of unknown function (DUF2786)